MFIKIVFVGLCICIFGILLKNKQNSYVFLAELAFGVFSMGIILNQVSESFSSLREIFKTDETARGIISCLFKGALVCVVTKLSSDICAEKGNSFISDIIEITGRVIMLSLTLPFIESVIKAALRFVS